MSDCEHTKGFTGQLGINIVVLEFKYSSDAIYKTSLHICQAQQVLFDIYNNCKNLFAKQTPRHPDIL